MANGVIGDNGGGDHADADETLASRVVLLVQENSSSVNRSKSDENGDDVCILIFPP
jgi:hypothetical protein